MAPNTRNTDGLTPRYFLDKGRFVYPPGDALEEMAETWLLLDAALDDADPNDGNIAAWLRHRQAALN